MDIENNTAAAFLKKNFLSEKNLFRLGGDASTRSYFRVHDTDRTAILCIDENLRGVKEATYPFFILHRLLSKGGVPVPQVIDVDEAAGLILQEDLGDLLLQDYCSAMTDKKIFSLYRSAINILIDIQSIKGIEPVPFGLAFDRDKLNFEFGFFITHTLKGFFGGEVNALLHEVSRSFEDISAAMDRPEFFVLNHRDYHSRNIMVSKDELKIIDFQDARLGLPQYDLVSLLYDPYFILKEVMRENLKNYYREAAAEKNLCTMSQDEFDYFYYLSAFQRNIKAVGSYGYLAAEADKPSFEQYIIPGLKLAASYADKTDQTQKAWSILSEYLKTLNIEVKP